MYISQPSPYNTAPFLQKQSDVDADHLCLQHRVAAHGVRTPHLRGRAGAGHRFNRQLRAQPPASPNADGLSARGHRQQGLRQAPRPVRTGGAGPVQPAVRRAGPWHVRGRPRAPRDAHWWSRPAPAAVRPAAVRRAERRLPRGGGAAADSVPRVRDARPAARVQRPGGCRCAGKCQLHDAASSSGRDAARGLPPWLPPASTGPGGRESDGLGLSVKPHRHEPRPRRLSLDAEHDGGVRLGLQPDARHADGHGPVRRAQPDGLGLSGSDVCTDSNTQHHGLCLTAAAATRADAAATAARTHTGAGRRRARDQVLREPHLRRPRRALRRRRPRVAAGRRGAAAADAAGQRRPRGGQQRGQRPDGAPKAPPEPRPGSCAASASSAGRRAHERALQLEPLQEPCCRRRDGGPEASAGRRVHPADVRRSLAPAAAAAAAAAAGRRRRGRHARGQGRDGQARGRPGRSGLRGRSAG
mmetsp:Transcript_26449/g.62557  ORF Transcript_26449/g.62557 Transcript_26449/m.62557 type:complete len:470 (-) Transcript_26449:312-1721(-)